jgi:hypothetical protein
VAILVLAIGTVAPALAQSSYTPMLTVGAELQAGTFLFMPNLSLIALTSLPIIGTHFEIIPNVGITYLFNPMTGISGNWYIPVGLELRAPDYKLAVVVRNLFAAAKVFGEGGVTVGVKAFLPFAAAGKSTFGISVEAGTAIFWNTTARPLFLIDLAPAFYYDYQVKVFS